MAAASLALFAGADGGTAAHHGEGEPHPAPLTVQHHRHAAPHGGAAAPQPYAGMEGREIKALSPQEVADLRAGRGMGLALPAELNRYPGPMHVLELAEPLRLSPRQRRRME